MTMKLLVALGVPLCAGLAGCASAPPPRAALPSKVALVAPDGGSLDALQVAAQAPFTVFVFFSRECPCLDAHDGRLRDLYAAYHPRGVQMVMVDSEVRATPETDAAEAARRAYPFPLLIDRGAKLAGALDARYATYSVVVDHEGRVAYRGGIDSDATHLKDSSTPYLRDALDDLLAGRPPRLAEAKALGCALETE
jgi:hypothetical protein